MRFVARKKNPFSPHLPDELQGPYPEGKATVSSKLTIHPIRRVVKNAWSYKSTYSLVVIV
jgi:hypothetical protein